MFSKHSIMNLYFFHLFFKRHYFNRNSLKTLNGGVYCKDDRIMDNSFNVLNLFFQCSDFLKLILVEFLCLGKWRWRMNSYSAMWYRFMMS